MHKIDFVLPWVDGNDSQWIAQKEKYTNSTNSQKDTHIQSRFRDMNTLKYVLRSIEQHAPWYNKIYLITTGHTPPWLELSHPKIELVRHDEFFIDKSALPVFNSSAIEMNLVNINGLADNFIYLNDDTIIIQPVNKDRFFRNGKVVDFFCHGWIPRGELFSKIKGRDTWVDSLNNNLKLINKDYNSLHLNKEMLYSSNYSMKCKISNFIYKNFYKELFWITHWHHPQPYTKKTIESVYNKYKDELIACSHNRFRSNKDLTQYIYRYWHLINGDFIPYNHNDGFVAKISSLEYLSKTRDFLNNSKNINFVCFNDQMNSVSDEEFNKCRVFLTNYLETIFSKKASFEN